MRRLERRSPRPFGGIEVKAAFTEWLARRYHLEKQLAAHFRQMLKKQWNSFVADLKAGTPLEQAISKLTDVSDEFRDRMLNEITMASSYGVSQGRDALPGRLGIGLDWKLVNEDASKRAQQYTYAEIQGITATTRDVLRSKVNDWIVSGEPLSTLTRDKGLVYLFGEKRAKKIAVTEVTRAYAEANQLVFQQTGVQRRRWNAGNDELMCPVCRKLNQKVAGINEPFPGGIMLPPAHPSCRCWITPMVEYVNGNSD